MTRTLLLAGIVAGICSIGSVAVKAAEQAPAASAAASKADLDKAQATVNSVCSACHGADGNSVVPANPSIAGMPADYITRQLQHFKAGIRVNPIMQGNAAQLSPEEMSALGAYFAQKAPKGLAARDAALVQAGQKLYRGGDAAAGVPACAACHAPNGAGIPKYYPRLAGQYADYTVSQLKAFKTGERGNDKEGKDVNGRIMGAIAARLSENQIRAAAEYTQGLR